MAISVTDPIERAFRRAKLTTFQPFELRRWFALGFVAWLATLDEGGGGSGNFNPGGGGGGGPVPPGPTTGPGSTGTGASPAAGPTGFFDDPWAWIMSHVLEVALIAAAILLVLAAVWLLVLWISSRGKFMFIEAIARNTCEVVAPWKQYRPLGNSLFAFRACLMGITWAAVLLIGGVALLLAWRDIHAWTSGGGAIAAIGVGLLIFPTLIVVGLVDWAANNFVAHIMYATGQTVLPAWREFRRDVMRGNVGTLVLLLDIVLSLGVALGRLLLGCATCCIGFLPYLSSVVALPLLVFLRAYPMYFLQQFSPRYVIIAEAPPPPGFPIYPAGWPQASTPPPPLQ